MAIVSFGQVVALEEARGASPQQADVGAAIVEAESGGSTTAQGDTSFGQGGGQYIGSLGIWQIFGQAHPQVSAACAEDPACSTDAARQISNNWTNWTPWTTYNTGAYRQFLGSSAALTSAPSGGPLYQTPLSPAGHALAGLAGGVLQSPFLQDLGSVFGVVDLKDLAWRAAFVVVGLILIFLGISILLRPTGEAAVNVLVPASAALRSGRAATVLR